MSTLNLSTNGPSINKSFHSVIDAPLPTGPAASSPTYGIWAVFSVSAPLTNAFAPANVGGESVLKVQSTGEGELIDLIDEFSDGKIQFAFAKVKDPNTSLFKNVLIAWCGEGVPERTKGYFTSHLNAVAKTLHGYHVQVAARSDRDLTPQSIVQKVSDASGSKYSGAISTPGVPPPPVASKPVFTPTQSSTKGAKFNPLADRAQKPVGSGHVDQDGWGEDAPPVTRTQLEKVQSSYQPTKIGLHGMSSAGSNNDAQNSSFQASISDDNIVKGAYQPIGRVDIAEIRRQAQKDATDDRPTPVKGAYEPVGKVDIAAIRARAQQPYAEASQGKNALATAGNQTGHQSSLPDRPVPLYTSERLTSLPKPKVANRFGPGAPRPGGSEAAASAEGSQGLKSSTVTLQTGVGRTFADQSGKTPAQIWAEKKAKESGGHGAERIHTPPIASQTSGGGEWKSSYAGKSWAPVQTTRPGPSQSMSKEPESSSVAESYTTDLSGIREQFQHKDTDLGGPSTTRSEPPALDVSNKPNANTNRRPGNVDEASLGPTNQDPIQPMPSPPPQPPRSPTPPTPPAVSSSPIRVAMPVGRSAQIHPITDAREELATPPSMPIRSLADAVPPQEDLVDDAAAQQLARGAAEATAATSFVGDSTASAQPGSMATGQRALALYDHEKAEPNELELREGETIYNIDMVDEDWWMGQNAKGESGLFPSNYVELMADTESRHAESGAPETSSEHRAVPAPQSISGGRTATALYDYEAAEPNELGFPENAKITQVEFPDEDWWSGSYRGQEGLFPANYVKLDD